MSQNKKNPDSPIPPILIDFVSLNNPKPDENEIKYEITETAARLSNQLVRDYPRLFENETTMIACLEVIIEELGRLHHDNSVRGIVLAKFGQNSLQRLVMSLTDLVKALRASHRVSKGIMGLIKDVAEGHKIHLH